MEFTDQLNQTMQLNEYPRRIISLVPSQTELLFYLGLEEEMVGITRYCTQPEDKTKHIPRVGGTKRFNFNLIDALNPDVIIGSKEENYPEGVLQLQKKYPVWISDVFNFETAIDMIQKVGRLVNRNEIANELARKIQGAFSTLQFEKKLTAAYLIWRNPYMSVGGDTFIHDMLSRAGFVNMFENEKRYPEVNENDLKSVDVIFISTEPYPFKESDVNRYKAQFSNQNVFVVDGAMFSWYGSRMLHMPQYFRDVQKMIS